MRLLIISFLLSTFFGTAQTKGIRKVNRESFAYTGRGISAWPKNPEEAALITQDQVVEFLTHTDSIQIQLAIKGKADVFSYRFAPLQPDKLYLVAVVSTGAGSPVGYQGIAAVYCQDALCSFDELTSRPEIDLSERLVSITDNGVFHVATEEWFGQQEPSTFWIYEMTNDGFVDASAKYRGWYDKHLLPKLEAQLDPNAIPVSLGMYAIRRYHGSAQCAMDDYRERVLGVKDAQMEHALEWANFPETEVLALSAVELAEDSPLVEKVLDALEKSASQYLRTQAFQLRKERAERRAEKTGR